MATSIQISENLHKELRKFSDKETYEEIIWDLVEDSRELTEETKKEIASARAEIKEGRFHSLDEVKKELGL